MIEINLLPKSYQKRAFDFSFGKSGLYVVAGAAAVIVLLIGVTIFQKYRLSSLEDDMERARQRAIMLEKDIKVVDALTDVKVKIQKRMAAVENLDSHRSSWVKLLEEIAGNVPEFVWMSKFKEKPAVAQAAPVQKKNTLTDTGIKKATQPTAAVTPTSTSTDHSKPVVRQASVDGHAFTLNALASFMIQMMRSDYFDKVELVMSEEVEIEKKKAYKFTLSCDVHYLSDEEIRNVIASAEDNTTDQNDALEHKSLN
jgi:Tfp pilus assembly protein PilN